MNKERLAAFSDGVIAVIITIMVLEMKVPHGSELGALWPLAPIFGSYVVIPVASKFPQRRQSLFAFSGIKPAFRKDQLGGMGGASKGQDIAE